MKNFANDWVIRILIYFFIATSILMFLYTFYRSEIVYNGKEFNHYLKYYLAFGLGAVFWFIVLFLKKNIRFNIVLTITTFIICLYTIEFFLKISRFAHYSESYVVAKKEGIDFDLRSDFEVYKDLKKLKTKVFPAVHSNMFLDKKNDKNSIYPIGGISKSTIVHCNESGTYSIYLSDRYGFNNPDSEWNSKETDWLLTGDSYAHGACVNPGEDIGSQIRTMTGDSVINLGTRGNGPLIELSSLIEYGKFQKPKKVLWTYYEGNDFINLNEEKSTIFINYLRSDYFQNLMNRQEEVDIKVMEKIETILSNSYNPILLKTSFLRLYETRFFIQKRFKKICVVNEKSKVYFFCEEKSNIDYFKNIDLFEKIILKAKNLTNDWGGELYFVYLPEYERYALKIEDHSSYKKREQVINLVKKLNIPVIDIHKEFFSKVEDPLSYFPFRLKGHYTKEGYKAVANVLIK